MASSGSLGGTELALRLMGLLLNTQAGISSWYQDSGIMDTFITPFTVREI